MKPDHGIQCMAAVRRAMAISISSAALAATAQTGDPGWSAGAVLDLSAASRSLALGQRDQGLGLGHSDINVKGPLGRHFDAQATVVAHTLDSKLAVELEEAWMQSRILPAGLQLRAGRFASQIGYLNEQHPHSDDFVQRPLLHRAFLGGHWTDDGLRINWTAPTDLYLRVGLEVFRGRRLVEEAAAARRPGAMVLSGRVGGDIGLSQSWQAGLSLLRNRREAAVENEEETHGAGEGVHTHGHGAAFSGRRMWLGEAAWKWAPQGNNRQQQLRVTYEHAMVERPNRFGSSSDRHHAAYLGVAWRFDPAWEAGVRYDVLRVRRPHDDGFEDGSLREAAVMLAYRPTHAQTLRLQFTQQRDRGGFGDANRAVQLQYILNFGSHAAHSF